MNNLIIRNETENDYAAVEKITRDAFWNLYVPGCNEHYLVHIMRSHEDFIHELDFVAELDGEIVGNVMYTKSAVTDENGERKATLTFGPLTVRPDFQRNGIGKKLLEHSFQKAISLGYDAVLIFGSPANYVSSGFKSCKKFNACTSDGSFPTAFLVKELIPDVFDGRKWVYSDSPVYHFDSSAAEEYDKMLEPKEKKYQPSQDEFFIYSHSTIK